MPTEQKQPLAPSVVIKILIVSLVVTALTAGYYYSISKQERRNNLQLKKLYQNVNTPTDNNR